MTSNEPKHARLSCSNHRWPHCPGSVAAESDYPNTSSAAAHDGTGSHLLLEKAMTEGVPIERYDGVIIGTEPDSWLVDKERIARVKQCLEYIARREKELASLYPGSDVIIESESKSNPGAYFGRVDWWGTCDVTITVRRGKVTLLFIEIIDYKDGRGWVDVKDNTQLLSYLGGRMMAIADDVDCRITIVQPRTSQPIRYQDMTGEYAAEKVRELAAAAELTDHKDATLASGKHCQWCKHKANCTEIVEDRDRRLKKMDTSLFDKSVDDMTSTELAEAAEQEKFVMEYFKSVKSAITDRIEKGEQVSGWKLAPGRGTYKWKLSEDEVIKALKGRKLKKDDYYPPKLITPAMMKKLDILTDDQKARLEKQLVEYVEGKPTLKPAPVADKPDASAMFADVIKQPNQETQINFY